jgi:hypothetical protein
MDGCKLCGKRMLTNRSPLIHRTCDACKAKQRREAHRKTAARRKAALRRQGGNASAALPAVRQGHWGSRAAC